MWRLARRLITIFLVCFCALLAGAESAIAQSEFPTDIPTAYQITGAEFTDFSFSDLPAVETSGAITSDFDEQVGYDLGRTWQSGDAIEDIIKLGDIAADFGPQTATLGQYSQVLGEDLGERSLAEFRPLINQSLDELSESVQYFRELPVSDTPPVAALFEQAGFAFDPDQQIGGALAANPALGELQLSNLGSALSEFDIGQLPNAETVRLDQLEGWENYTLSDIPGLQDVPFNQFPAGIGLFGGGTARIDFVWGTAESDRNNTISGSFQAGFAVPCPNGGQLTGFEPPYDAPEANDPVECAYIELDDLENEGREQQSEFEGKQWISGKYQEVEGGFGPLRFVPSPLGFSPGYEPTGRHPFGSAFKVVVWEPNELTDEISFKLLFRICSTLPFVGRTCTPYNQFSVPFVSHRINDIIFIGAVDGSGGSSSSGGFSGNTPYGATRFGVPGVPPAYGPCTGQVVDGINIDALAEAIAQIESQGSGGYKAVGVYLCDSVGNCGRGLGRYQTMSYLPEVQSRVRQEPGGAAFLDRVENGYRPTQAELLQYYPPELQESAYQDELGQLLEGARGEVDPTTGKPFQGGRLIERVTQKWFGGPGAPIDGGGSDALGRLSLYDYGVEARQNYLAQGGQPSSACAAAGAGPAGTATGNIVNPAPGYRLTSDFGPRNIGCQYSKFHPAVDIGTPIGTPISASDGGVVQYSSCNAGGYGCTVVIDHGDGTKTRYSHLRRGSLIVRQGQAVAQGQQIGEGGNTGSSTGPHLDYGIYVNDPTGPGQLPAKPNAINPEPIIF